MKRVAILISGGGSNMVALVDSMTGDHPARPVLVLANSDAAAGLAKAQARGIATSVVPHQAYATREDFDAALNAELETVSPDIICLAGFMRILTPVFTDRWQDKVLNIHPSLLPKYPGLNTHQRALDAGDAEAGCTVHVVTSVLDDGPILGQARVAIQPGDTAQRLASRVLPMEHRLYPAVLRRFAEGNTEAVCLQDGVDTPMTSGLLE